jgi:hypothetical protein
VAETDFAPVIDTVHELPVPLQAPDQPAKLEPEAALAVSTADFPLTNLTLQLVPQLTPAGLLVTLPAPDPAFVTVSAYSTGGGTLKVAVAEALPFKVSLQVDVPLHEPDQPANLEPDFGLAVSVIDFPLAYLALHVFPQLIPDGLLVIVPEPLPASFTHSSNSVVALVKVAVTDVFAFTVSVHAAVPLQAPDQPIKLEPDLETAVSVTTLPRVTMAWHADPQLMPAGLSVMVPCPEPAALSVS